MLRLMVGTALGFACGYLLGSERAREEAYRRFSSAPEPVRQVADRLTGAISATQSGSFGGSQVAEAFKRVTTRGTDAVQTAQLEDVAVAPPEVSA